MRNHPRVHAFMTSLALCLTLVALAVVLSGCKSQDTPDDNHPTQFVRESVQPCRCATRPALGHEGN